MGLPNPSTSLPAVSVRRRYNDRPLWRVLREVGGLATSLFPLQPILTPSVLAALTAANFRLPLYRNNLVDFLAIFAFVLTSRIMVSSSSNMSRGEVGVLLSESSLVSPSTRSPI